MAKEKTVPAATTQAVVQSTPPKVSLPKKVADAIKAKREIEERIRREAAQYDDDIKRGFEEQLDACCQMYEALKGDYPNLLSEPRYERFLTVLNIHPTTQTRERKPRTRTTKEEIARIRAEITDYAAKKEEAVTIPELMSKLGLDRPTAQNNVKALVSDGKLKENGKAGKTLLFVLTK